MKSAACVIVALMLTTGCAFNLGPIQLAVGDSYVEECEGDSETDAEGRITKCEKGYDRAEGGKLSEPVVSLGEAVFNVLANVAGAFLPGGGAGSSAGVAE